MAFDAMQKGQQSPLPPTHAQLDDFACMQRLLFSRFPVVVFDRHIQVQVDSLPSIHITFCCLADLIQESRHEAQGKEEYEQLFKVNSRRCKAAMKLGEKHQEIHVLAVAYSAAAKFAEDKER